MTLADVACWATRLGIASFVAFAVQILFDLVARLKTADASRTAAGVAEKAAKGEPLVQDSPSVAQLTELVRALTAAMEAIVKAGPGLAGLVASVLFLGIAAWAVAPPVGKPKCSITDKTAVTLADGRTVGAVPVACE